MKTHQPVKVIFMGSRPASIQILNIIEKFIMRHGKKWIDLTVLANTDNHPPSGVIKWWKVGGLEKEARKKGFKVLTSSTQIENKSFDLGINIFSTDIIPEDIIKNMAKGIVNLHFGYLPTVGYSKSKGSPHLKGTPFSKGTYRGSNVLSHSILNREKWQAVTLHFISSRIDLGPVIAQSWNSITAMTTAWDLQIASEKKAIEIFERYFPVLVNNSPSIKIIKPGKGKYPYYNRQSLQSIKVLPPDISSSRLKLIARALSFPNTEPPYFLEKSRKGFFFKRYVLYRKDKGLSIMEPTKKTYIQKLADVS